MQGTAGFLRSSACKNPLQVSIQKPYKTDCRSPAQGSYVQIQVSRYSVSQDYSMSISSISMIMVLVMVIVVRASTARLLLHQRIACYPSL